MHRADGVVHLHVGLSPELLDRLGGHLDVPKVVGGLEHPEDGNAVLHRLLDELADGSVRIGSIGEDVLAPQEHLKFGIGHDLLDSSQSLPRIFLQVSQADVKAGPSPYLHRIEATVVQGRAEGEKVIRGNSRGELAMLAIPRGQVRNLDPFGADRCAEQSSQIMI